MIKCFSLSDEANFFLFLQFPVNVLKKIEEQSSYRRNLGSGHTTSISSRSINNLVNRQNGMNCR